MHSIGVTQRTSVNSSRKGDDLSENDNPDAHHPKYPCARQRCNDRVVNQCDIQWFFECESLTHSGMLTKVETLKT